MSKKVRRLSVIALVLLIASVIWLFRPDPRVAKAMALQQELFGPGGKQLSSDQRQQKWREFREVTKGLSSAQRRQLGAEGRKQKQREVSRYFRMSPRERTQYLDQQIRREQQMRQQMQARGGAAGGRGQGQSKGSSSNRSEQERDRNRQRFLDSSTAAERAQMSQFRRELNARRSQLGLPAGSRGFGPSR